MQLHRVTKGQYWRVEAIFLQDVLQPIAEAGKIKTRELAGNDVADDYKGDEILLENANKARGIWSIVPTHLGLDMFKTMKWLIVRD